jgi:hypothetical protein
MGRSSTTAGATHHTFAILRAIDSVVPERSLLFGSLPPHGRDIDLLVLPAGSAAIEASLEKLGLVRRGSQWLSFRGCSACAVELIQAATLGLPPAELRGLFAEAVPLQGLSRVVEPAPHHALLILARKLAHQPGSLAAKHRTRIDRAIASYPDAWEAALTRAPLWGAERSLARLRRRHARGRPGFVLNWRRLVRRPRRSRVIAFSGVDAAVNALQACFLCDTLVRLGFDAVVERRSPSRTRLRLLEALSFWQPVWRALGRGKIVIFDRYVLDVAVSSRDGKGAQSTRQMRLLDIVSPRPCCAFLLDVLPEEPAPREPSQNLFDDLHRAQFYRAASRIFEVRPVDTRRSAELVCEQIATDVWQALTQTRSRRSVARNA